MNLPFYIAKRYLFSKKSHNAINLISGISIAGVAITTMALILVLSAFNGIETLVENLYSSFDPDIQLTLRKGKTFKITDFPAEEVQRMEGVKYFTPVIEETVLLKHEDRWMTATMKGVNEDFLKMTAIDTLMDQGLAYLHEDNVPYAILGRGVRNRLGVPVPSFQSITVHGLLRNKKIRKDGDAFNKQPVLVSGVFSINPEFDNNYLLVPISFASDLLEYSDDITGVEIGLSKGADEEAVKEKLQQLLGNNFKIQTRYEQNELIYKTNKTEKWITFLILYFILIIATFNIIASLTMLILDKRDDMHTLVSFGATKKDIRKIFFYEGMLINLFGAGIGLTLGLVLCFLQLWFGLVPLEGTIVDAYPVRIEWLDIAFIMLTVLGLGIVSSYLPVRYLIRRHFS